MPMLFVPFGNAMVNSKRAFVTWAEKTKDGCSAKTGGLSSCAHCQWPLWTNVTEINVESCP